MEKLPKIDMSEIAPRNIHVSARGKRAISEHAQKPLVFDKYVKKDSVLDVGCSTGTFLLCCKKLGYKDVYGVDLNKKTNEYCIKKLKLPVSTAIPNKKFNLIHLSDIIEHLQDPDKFIKSIKKRLMHKGVILLTTPNINNLLNWILNIKPKEHLFYFSKRTIRLLLEKNNLKLIKIKSWNRYHPLQHLVDTSTGEKVKIARILIALKLDALVNNLILKNLYTDILVIAQNQDRQERKIK